METNNLGLQVIRNETIYNYRISSYGSVPPDGGTDLGRGESGDFYLNKYRRNEQIIICSINADDVPPDDDDGTEKRGEGAE